MTYPVHALLAFGGPMWTDDIWSCSLRMSIPTGVPDLFSRRAWAEASLEDVANDVHAYVSSWNCSGVAKLGYVKFNIIGPDGKYEDKGETNVKFYTAPLAAGGGASRYPPQVALCLTHHTDLTRGPGSKGRMFLPVPSADLESALPMISATDAQGYANAHATFLKNLDEWPGGDPTSGGEVRVYSKVGEGSSNKVTSVSCGRILDTIRSRRSAFTELPVVSTVSI